MRVLKATEWHTLKLLKWQHFCYVDFTTSTQKAAEQFLRGNTCIPEACQTFSLQVSEPVITG